jgi:dipeptidyl aminopeptidase/acylaminoacyl peptidase
MTFLCLAAFTRAALAQDAAASAVATKPLTVEGAVDLRFISDLQMAADGMQLAFVVTEPATEDGRATHVWMYDKRSGAVRQFTYSKKSEKWPRWSPDGKTSKFL